MNIFETEGIRYSGSKKQILPRIHEVIKNLPIKTVLDGFSGTTRVSQYLKQAGYSVTCNDLADYSFIFGKTYIENVYLKTKKIQDKIDHLNTLAPVHGFFAANYGGHDDGKGGCFHADGKKKPLTVENAAKLDAVRSEIDRMTEGEVEKSILLTSLINAVDKVENTLGHQVAYLSKWSSRAKKPLFLQMPRLISGNQEYKVLKQDAATIQDYHDLAYFDPPYGTNNTHTPTTRVRYASYYHFWKTVVLNDAPKVIGASNRRFDCSSDKLPNNVTLYESTNYDTCRQELKNLVSGSNSVFVLLSYSNKSKVSVADLTSDLQSIGKTTVISFPHKENVQKKLTSNEQWMGDQSENLEYLFLVEKK